MSGGIAFVWDVDGSFSSKCNREMVELCKLEDKEDLDLVKTLLQEFKDLTGSVIADQLLKEFKTRTKEFVKVFPYEYQKVLKQKIANGVPAVQQAPVEPSVKDIEDSVANVTLEQKKADRALDKIRGTLHLI